MKRFVLLLLLTVLEARWSIPGSLHRRKWRRSAKKPVWFLKAFSSYGRKNVIWNARLWKKAVQGDPFPEEFTNGRTRLGSGCLRKNLRKSPIVTVPCFIWMPTSFSGIKFLWPAFTKPKPSCSKKRKEPGNLTDSDDPIPLLFSWKFLNGSSLLKLGNKGFS